MHWAVALVLVVQVFLEVCRLGLFRQGEAGGGLDVTATLSFVLGALLLALVLLRVSIRREIGVPMPATPLAGYVHYALYFLLILSPVSGAVAWITETERSESVHDMMKFLLFAVVFLHIFQVLWGQFVAKDGTLRRMLPARD